MNIKLFEIRDRDTLIPIIALRLGGRDEAERWLLARAGFGKTWPRQNQYTVLFHVSDQRADYDPYRWHSRTLTEAHQFIAEHWDGLESGAVVDVEFIIGKSPRPKRSERFDSGQLMPLAVEEL